MLEEYNLKGNNPNVVIAALNNFMIFCFDLPSRWEFMKVKIAFKTEKSAEIKDKQRKDC